MQNKIEATTLYTPQFLLVSFSSFLFFVAFNMILPELPDFLSSMGGEEHKGLIIALATISAGLSRPFSGKLADTIGRKPVILFGIFITVVCSISYPIFAYLLPFFALRFLNGFATGFTPTGNSAVITDITPIDRRGEAMGMLGLISNTGTSIGPVLGSYLATDFSTTVMFVCSGCFAVAAFIISLKIKETIPYPVRFHKELLKINRHEIIDANVLPAAYVMALCIFAYGVMLTVIPDFSTHLGVPNKGIFFTIYTLSSLAVRLFAGKFSDKYGRVRAIKVALILLVITHILFAYTNSQIMFYLTTVLFGISVGIYSPTLFAWAADLSSAEHRGRGFATLYIALEIGIGLGAFISGIMYDNRIENLFWVFILASFLVFLAFIYLVINFRGDKLTR